MSSYIPQFFIVQELVPPAIYHARGGVALELIDANLLITIDKLRQRYGRMIINNWHCGGEREWSGLRTPGSPFYRQNSMHSYGKAVDIVPIDNSVDEIRGDIIRLYNTSKGDDFKHIHGIELGVSWLHIDTRNRADLLQFKCG